MSKLFKDPFSALSHWLGVVFALGGGLYLWDIAKPGNQLAVVLYSSGMLALYLASAVYHTVRRGTHAEEICQKLDHSAIYVMIMASYLPTCLIALKGPWGTGMALTEVACAVIGVALTFGLKKVPGKVRVPLYLVMGWIAVVALGPMSKVLPPQQIGWLFAGGIVYSIGAVVYVVDKPHLVKDRFYAHDLWHIFVLGGTLCHFVLNSYVIRNLN